jgi:hypothetical protein
MPYGSVRKILQQSGMKIARLFPEREPDDLEVDPET